MPDAMTLNPLFSDGAVFQAGRPIRVFGSGDGAATVTLDGVSSTAASRGGFWLAELPARPHGGPFCLEVAMGGKAVAYQGASTIQSWMPPDVFSGDLFSIPDAQMHPDHFNPEYFWNRPGFLRAEILRQLIPFPFGHVVWYQGESNTTTAEGDIYDKMLEAMVARWRRDFVTPELPFLIVQTADFDGRADARWNSVQKAQERACGLIPAATLVRSADVCESDAIHPPTKSRLAERLAGRI